MKDRFLLITIFGGVVIAFSCLLYLHHAGKVHERARRSGFPDVKTIEIKNNFPLGPVETRYDPTNGTVSE